MSLAPPQLPSPAATPDQLSSQHPSPNATEEEIRDQVEKRLLLLSQDLYELEICAGEVVAGQEDRVPNFLQSINEHYVVLNDLGRRMNDTVPFQVVESVDMHRNPHGYTKNALSIATGENQYSLGRVLGLESFRRELHDALGREFPTVPLPERQHQPKIDSGEPEQTKMAQNGTKDGVIKTETSSSTAAVNSASVNPPSAQEPTQTNDAQLPP